MSYEIKTIDELESIHGVRVLAIGCTPEKAYERPEDFRTGARV